MQTEPKKNILGGTSLIKQREVKRPTRGEKAEQPGLVPTFTTNLGEKKYQRAVGGGGGVGPTNKRGGGTGGTKSAAVRTKERGGNPTLIGPDGL